MICIHLHVKSIKIPVHTSNSNPTSVEISPCMERDRSRFTFVIYFYNLCEKYSYIIMLYNYIIHEILYVSCLIYHNGAFWLRNIPAADNCSMITLGQRWLTVVPLADSCRSVYNVGPTLGKHQYMLYENWKTIPFLFYDFRTEDELWTNMKNYTCNSFYSVDLTI